eukprot:m.29910 g.29910  ORF g.29910 m.29910 type:complete len:949 (-) comp4718_c0_seq1:183-3029(-)
MAHSRPSPTSPLRIASSSPMPSSSPLHGPPSPAPLLDPQGRTSMRQKRLFLSFQYVVVDSVLIVTVKEGKNFAGDAALDEQPRLRSPNPYINIFVNPDPSGLNKYKTQVHSRTESPAFSEAFKISLRREEDGFRRIHISAWDWQEDGRADVFLGTMSFEVNELLPPAAKTEGWFLLMGREEGATRHIRLADRSGSFSRDGVSVRPRPWSAASVRSRTGSSISLTSADGDSLRRLRDSSEMGSMMSINGSSGSAWPDFQPGSTDVDLDEDSPDTPNSPFFDGDLSQLEQQRQKLIVHLRSEVDSYCADLATLNELFTEPLQSDLTSDQHDRIFANIDRVTDLATTFRAQLHARIAAEYPVRLVGDLLKDTGKAMQGPYMMYCANKHVADQDLRAVMQSNPEIAELVRTQGTTRRVDLQGLLARPVGFISWLPAIMDRMASFCPRGHDDHYNMQEASMLFRKLVETISSEVKKVEAYTRMMVYQQRLVFPGGIPELKLLQGRSFVREGEALIVAAKPKLPAKGKELPRAATLVLFSDVVLLCEKSTGKGEPAYHVLVRPLFLAETALQLATPDTDLVLATAKEQITLRFTNARERGVWYKQLGDTSTLPPTPAVARSASLFSIDLTAPREIAVGRVGRDPGFSLRPDVAGFVCNVVEGGPAAAAGLTDLDQIISVNGVAVDALTHEGIAELIVSSTEDPLRLVVMTALRRCAIIRDPDGGVGMVLRGSHPPFVRSLKPGGPAEKAGMRLGDQLWEVDGGSVRHLSHDSVAQLVQTVGHNFTVLVRPTLRALYIPRGPNGYGFRLRQPPAKGQPLFVCSVLPDGGARAAGLRLGDQLWELNGLDVRGKALRPVEDMVTTARDGIRVVVVSTLRTIDVIAQPGEAFGFSLQGCRLVRTGIVDPGSPAARAGLSSGVAIWEVNNVDVTNATHQEVVELIRKHPNRVRLLVALA